MSARQELPFLTLPSVRQNKRRGGGEDRGGGEGKEGLKIMPGAKVHPLTAVPAPN